MEVTKEFILSCPLKVNAVLLNLHGAYRLVV